VHVVNVVVDDGAQGLGFVEAGHFAAGGADAGHRGAQRGTGATKIEAHFIEFVEGNLDIRSVAALEHDVAGLTMERDQTRTAGFQPGVTELAQQVGGVMHARGRLDAQGVELGRFREHGVAGLILELGETGDHATAVTEHTNRTPLPVSLHVLIGRFQLAHQVDHHVAVLGQTLESGHEAGPRAFLELVQIGRINHFLCHSFSPRTFRNARSASA
jgi:hypothetical protein